LVDVDQSEPKKTVMGWPAMLDVPTMKPEELV
jgi:hypothetical protein